MLDLVLLNYNNNNMDNIMCRCKGCDIVFTPEEVWETSEYGEKVKFIGFEELCNNCATFCWSEETYEELFSYTWVKPIISEKYFE